MKAKRIFLPVLLLTSLILTGCAVKIANITPSTIPANPSGIYTLSAKATVKNKAVEPGTVKAYIVIDGEKLPMKRSEDLGSYYFEYDYDIPEERDTARFYYLLNYRMKTLTGTPGEMNQAQSPLEEIRLIDRYSITLDANRAPVGTQLAVLGRGFSRSDTVYIGGMAASTTFVSQNSLQFIVPNLEPSNSYPVDVGSFKNLESAGTLRIDPGPAVLPTNNPEPYVAPSYVAPVTRTVTPTFTNANALTVVPDSLDLKVGERVAMAFALSSPAPQGGLYLDVTTDISNAIIMPEVIVPVGARTVNVTIEAAEVAEGSLFINGKGIQEITIPVKIQ